MQPPPCGRTLELLLRDASDNLSITITGGEPLLDFQRVQEIVAVVERVLPAASNVSWKLMSNGLLLDFERLAFLDAHGFVVALSFDGVPAAQSLRGRGTFQRLNTLLDVLRVHHSGLFRERLKISMVLTPRTIANLGASLDYFLEKGVRDISIAPATGPLGWRLEQIEELDAAFARVSAIALSHYRTTCEVPVSIFRRTRPDVPDQATEWVCAAPDRENLTLDVDGVAYGCVMASATYQRPGQATSPAVAALRVGNPDDRMFDQNLAEMPERARASGAFDHPERRYSSYRRCSDCEYLGRCDICPLANAREADATDPYRVQDFLCAFNMVALAHRDRFPCQTDPFDLLTGAIPFPRFDV